MEEIWRDIKGYEGKYQVSNLGRVKSLKDSHGNYREKILSGFPHKDGYLLVNLYKNSKKKPYYIHRLVALHFIDNSNNYKEINHKDENKTNNKVSNLEWCTRKYNNKYGTHNKRVSESNKGKYKGSKHPRARKVLCITTGKIFNCIKEAEEYYKVAYQSISRCCRGKRNSAGKHPDTGEKLKWKYID